MALALADAADLIWLMDDDTVPEPGALRGAAGRPASATRPRPPALVASRVLWTDGRAHPMNTPRRQAVRQPGRAPAAAAAGCVPIRSASFVSILVDAGACRRRGLPQADYFLWNDDFEFTTRLLRGNAGLLCPASVVVHKTATFGSTDADPGERFFYEVRNKIWMLTVRLAAGPAGAGPVRRVDAAPLGPHVRPLARPAHARVRHWLRGVAAGVRTRPAAHRGPDAGAARRPDSCRTRLPEAQRGRLRCRPSTPAGTRVITAGSW